MKVIETYLQEFRFALKTKKRKKDSIRELASNPRAIGSTLVKHDMSQLLEPRSWFHACAYNNASRVMIPQLISASRKASRVRCYSRRYVTSTRSRQFHSVITKNGCSGRNKRNIERFANRACERIRPKHDQNMTARLIWLRGRVSDLEDFRREETQVA